MDAVTAAGMKDHEDMPWLAKLDARARRWPLPIHWGYLGVKWGLALMGAASLIGIWYQRDPWLGLLQAGLLALIAWDNWTTAPAPAPAPAPRPTRD